MASRLIRQPRSSARAGALMWVVQPLYIVCELVAAAAATAPYSLVDNTISDLGATTCTTIAYPYGDVAVCSPLNLVVNGAFVVFGVLMALGALLLRSWLPQGAAATTAVVLWVITGLSSIATGLVPLDRNLDLHSLVALPALVAQPLALLVSAYVLRHRRPVASGPDRGRALARRCRRFPRAHRQRGPRWPFRAARVLAGLPLVAGPGRRRAARAAMI
jgi:hypothetical membrane protein